MFRHAAARRSVLTAAPFRSQVVARRLPLSQTQLYSTKSKPNSNESRSVNRGYVIGTLGIFSLLGIAAYFIARSSEVATAKHFAPHQPTTGDEVPEICPADLDGVIDSPVKVVQWEQVWDLLRKKAHSFKFDGHGGLQGRIDSVKLDSNERVEDEWAVGVGAGVGGNRTLYAGVYDGHAGWATSTLLRRYLIPYVAASLAPLPLSAHGQIIDTAVQNAFCRLDDKIMSASQIAVETATDFYTAEALSALAPAIAGSCALLAMYDMQTSTLRTAVTGDSRAVLGSWSTATNDYVADVVSKDQTGFNQDEVQRISQLHPGEKEKILDPESGRLMGLAITRAFGDHRWKFSNDFVKTIENGFAGFSPAPQSKTPPYVTARPELTTRQVQRDDFVIMASDGLWDVMSSEDAVACVSQWCKERNKSSPKPATSTKGNWKIDKSGHVSYKATAEHFTFEDKENAAVCLLRNALGGSRRNLVLGALTSTTPLSRYFRDDITIQVIFFNDPHQEVQ